MVNPASIMKMMNLKNKFEQTHPKFASFIATMLRQGMEEGTVLEITVTKPDGSQITGNMRVTASDLELVEEMKNLAQ